MDAEPISGSLERLEAAVARIEAAAAMRPAAQAPSTLSSTQPDEELARRHETLKTAVGGALARLDALIAQQP